MADERQDVPYGSDAHREWLQTANPPTVTLFDLWRGVFAMDEESDDIDDPMKSGLNHRELRHFLDEFIGDRLEAGNLDNDRERDVARAHLQAGVEVGVLATYLSAERAGNRVWDRVAVLVNDLYERAAREFSDGEMPKRFAPHPELADESPLVVVCRECEERDLDAMTDGKREAAADEFIDRVWELVKYWRKREDEAEGVAFSTLNLIDEYGYGLRDPDGTKVGATAWSCTAASTREHRPTATTLRSTPRYVLARLARQVRRGSAASNKAFSRFSGFTPPNPSSPPPQRASGGDSGPHTDRFSLIRSSGSPGFPPLPGGSCSHGRKHWHLGATGGGS